MSTIEQRLGKKTLFFPKTKIGDSHSLKIVNDDVELSLGSDDNAGCSDVYDRSEIAFFTVTKDEEKSKIIKNHPLVVKYGDQGDGTIDCWNDPEKFVKVVADFLGFEIKQKD